MKKKLALALSMVMILSLALTGCGNNDKGSNTSSTSGGSNTSASTSTPNNETPSGEKVDITIATGSTSANYYAIGNVMATVLNPVLTKGNIGVTSTGASAANVQLLQDNEVNFAIIQNDVAYYAATGTDLFDGEDPYEDWGALCALYDEVVQVFTLNPDIKTFTDLKGKTVSIGASGSGVYYNALDILAAYDMTEADINAQYQDFGNSADALQDGKIDAAFVVAGAPTVAITTLATAKDTYLVGLDDEHIAKLKEASPYYEEYTIPEGTYEGVPETKTVAVSAVVVARDDVSEEDVYNIVYTIFENMDNIAQSHDKGKELSLDFAAGVTAVPYHPGAAKYFAEKGYDVPTK